MEPAVPESEGEPLRALALVIAVVVALVALAVAFGVNITADQTSAIVGAVGAIGTLAVWIIGRRNVTPTKNVVAVVDKAGDVVAGQAAPLPNGLPVRVQANPLSPGGVA